MLAANLVVAIVDMTRAADAEMADVLISPAAFSTPGASHIGPKLYHLVLRNHPLAPFVDLMNQNYILVLILSLAPRSLLQRAVDSGALLGQLDRHRDLTATTVGAELEGVAVQHSVLGARVDSDLDLVAVA